MPFIFSDKMLKELLDQQPIDGELAVAIQRLVDAIIEGLQKAALEVAIAGTNDATALTPYTGRVATRVQTGVVTPEAEGAPSTGDTTAGILAAETLGRQLALADRDYEIGTGIEQIEAELYALAHPAARFVSTMDGDSLIRDRNGRVIGLVFNHPEALTYPTGGANPSTVPGTVIPWGYITKPPVSSAAPASPTIKNCAHFYADWGTEWYRTRTGIGDMDNPPGNFYGWKDGRWNFTSNPTHDPDRLSIMGYYPNDNPNVVDWQLYWLKEAGFSSWSPCIFDLNIDTWHMPSDRHYWFYRACYEAGNFKTLSHMMWLRSSNFGDAPTPIPTPTQLIDDWRDQLFSFGDEHQNKEVIEFGGRRYPAYYVWDASWQLFYSFSNNVTNYVNFLKARADDCKARGYAGIALLCHNLPDDATMNRQDLLNYGVLLRHSPYSGAWASNLASADYAGVVSSLSLPFVDIVPVVSTSLKAVPPLPSSTLLAYKYDGSTPDLYGDYLSAVARHVEANRAGIPGLIMHCNVSEWAEQGAGLHPTKGQGWGYLDQVRKAMNGISTVAKPNNTPAILCTLTQSAVQSIPNAVTTSITNWIEELDNNDMHVAGFPARITVRRETPTRFVQVIANWQWAVAAGTSRQVILFKNNAEVARDTRSPLDVAAGTLTWTGAVLAGDEFQLRVYQDSGGSINFGGDSRTRFTVLSLY